MTQTDTSPRSGGDERVSRASAQQIEDKLRESEERLTRIVDAAMDAIVAVDDEQRIIVFNLAAEKMFRCSASHAIGTSFERFIPARFRTEHHAYFFQIAEAGVTDRMTGSLSPLWALRADGEEFPIAASISRSGGNANGLFIAFVRDLTERKRADAILHESEERFRLAMVNVASGVYTLDLNGLVTYVNPAAEAMFGWTNADLLGKKMHDVTHYKHPDGSPFPASDCPGLQVLQKGVELREHEDVFIRKDGRFFPVVYSASPLKSEDKTVGIVVGFRDDRLRREAERAVRESEERFRLMADAAPVMIWITGLDRLCTYCNRHFLEFTGRALEAELGNGWTDGVHPDDFTRCLETYFQAFDKRLPLEMEYRLRRHDGEYRCILDSGAPIFSPDGSFAGYVGSAIDITDERLATEALSNLSRSLMEAQEKERASIARELHDDLAQRVALTAMALDEIQRHVPLASPILREKLQAVRHGVEQLGSDIHRLSHNLHSAVVTKLGLAGSLRQLCREVSEQMRIRVDCVCSDISCSLPDDVALAVFRVGQECLANVVKHSQAREARVTLSETPAEVRLTVTDRGVGFDVSRIRANPGLGLTSIQERARMIGADLNIRSTPSNGTTVELRLPTSVVNL